MFAIACWAKMTVCGERLIVATLFKDMTYTVEGLVREVERGDIALPEIQRPFVWNAAKVRDLFDSMYKGFPVGFSVVLGDGAGSG